MRYVLDASVAVKWVLPEADSAKALQLLDDFRAGIHELIAPEVFPVEVAHALTRAERQGIIKPPDAVLKLADVMRNRPDLHPYVPLLGRAADISSATRHGVYDCLYVTLAEQEGCELVTADSKLIKNLGTSFPFIVDLAKV
jgi:predicted nucleic acid-binding protein